MGTVCGSEKLANYTYLICREKKNDRFLFFCSAVMLELCDSLVTYLHLKHTYLTVICLERRESTMCSSFVFAPLPFELIQFEKDQIFNFVIGLEGDRFDPNMSV